MILSPIFCLKRLFFGLLILLPVFLLLNGCVASSKAYSRAIAPEADGVSLSDYENLEINLQSRRAVPISTPEKTRISNLIRSKITESHPNIFKEIGVACNKPSTLVLNVLITKYERGNSNARMLSAGYGQMHINAIVSLEDKDSNRMLAQHAVKKTFAWGGIYGGTKTIEDIEHGFVAAIVDIILKLNG